MEKITLEMILSWEPPIGSDEINVDELNAYVDASDAVIRRCEYAAMDFLDRSTFLDLEGANKAREQSAEADSLIIEIKTIRGKIKNAINQNAIKNSK